MCGGPIPMRTIDTSVFLPVYSDGETVHGVSMACGALAALKLIDSFLPATGNGSAVSSTLPLPNPATDFSRNLVRDYRYW